MLLPARFDDPPARNSDGGQLGAGGFLRWGVALAVVPGVQGGLEARGDVRADTWSAGGAAQVVLGSLQQSRPWILNDSRGV